MNHAWLVIKVSRYLNRTKVFDRRVESKRTEVDMRSQKIDRRHIPTQQELEKVNNHNIRFFRATLLGQRFLHEYNGQKSLKPRKNKYFCIRRKAKKLINKLSSNGKKNLPAEQLDNARQE
jgi:hypothetical protein